MSDSNTKQELYESKKDLLRELFKLIMIGLVILFMVSIGFILSDLAVNVIKGQPVKSNYQNYGEYITYISIFFQSAIFTFVICILGLLISYGTEWKVVNKFGSLIKMAEDKLQGILKNIEDFNQKKILRTEGYHNNF